MTVLALVGPTASGKSTVAVDVARARRAHPDLPEVEIVAGDAFTIYRGMDVGTAKPDPVVRAEIVHHLIDARAPDEDVSVAWFQRVAREVIAGIEARGHVPLLVGGSGLYVRAVVDDLRFPPTDPAVRARIEARYRDDPPAAHAALTRVDPAAAARIQPDNLRRSVRALEVIELTGAPFSAYDDAFDRYESVYPDLRMRGLRRPREQLRARIRERTDRMVDGGLLEEAQRLRAAGGLSTTAAQAIGYAEAFAVLDGELTRDELVDAIARRTWRYARRQLKWFERDPRVVWSSPAEVLEAWAG